MNDDSVSLDLTPDPKILIALTHTKLQPIDALCELIDNSIDSFVSAKKQGISIDNPMISIELPKMNEIDKNKGIFRISDNGPGLTDKMTENALRAGYSTNNNYDSLGLFGMGFNISSGKIGSVKHFFTAREENELALEVIIDLNEINSTKNYLLKANRVNKGNLKHGTIIEIDKWWPLGSPNRDFIKTLVRYGTKKIRENLERRYATILRKKEISLYINGCLCEPFEHCVWSRERYVERQKYGRIPAVIDFDEVIYTQKRCAKCSAILENNQNQCPNCQSYEIKTIDERIKGWVGIQRFDSLSNFGIDLIRNGRAIRIAEKNAFFEYVDEFQNTIKDYPIDSNYGRIVGEVYLDFVPVDFMKQDFQRSSAEWQRAITYLRGDSSLQPMQPGAENNNSPIFRLFQGYRKVKTAGKTDLYMGVWDTSKNEPRRISRDVENEFYENFKQKKAGYFDDSEWWKKVEEADSRPVKQMPLCPTCGCQNLEEAEVCVGCHEILKPKECINCGEKIPQSAKLCPVCSANQEIEPIKAWTCAICGEKNSSSNQICSRCNLPQGEENHLALEYLLKNATKDDTLSIEACSVELADTSISSAIKVSVYLTTKSITPNLSGQNIPLISFKQINEVSIFIDKSHVLFQGCKMAPEQMIAYEIADQIYALNATVRSFSNPNSIAYIAWKIIEKYWVDKLIDDFNVQETAIENLFAHIKERLFISRSSELSECFDFLNDSDKKIFVNTLLNAGEDITHINELKDSGTYIKFAPFSFIIDLFVHRPEIFFEGSVWNETYSSAPSDIRSFVQERLKNMYLSCLKDILFYLTYQNPDTFIIQRVSLAVRFLYQRLAE